MKKFILISTIFIFCAFSGFTQNNDTPLAPTDTTKSVTVQDSIAKDVLSNYSSMYTPGISNIDTTKSTYYWRITERTGERIPGNPDTVLTDYPNRRIVEGSSISMAYLGNLGLPAESRLFFERPERSNFMFFDPYYVYTKSPDRFNFINTKIPYSNLTYQSAGSRNHKEEQLQGCLSLNFGKSINVGFDIDYMYARGFYQSQSAKHLDWVFFGSYITDRHNLHLFINPADYTNAENGGIANDTLLYDPGLLDQNPRSDEIPVRFLNTWNRMKSQRYYLTYRYNLGFEKDTEKQDKEGNEIKEFIPVSSIIYTFDYTTKNRRFNSLDSITIDSAYNKVDHFGTNKPVNDSTSYWQLRNTIGLSLREGFSQWAKFDLTAFLTQDFRSNTIMNNTFMDTTIEKSSTYIGGEIAKRTGKTFRYNAQGNFGLAGENMGDFEISGNVQTRIPVLGDTASVTGFGSIKYLEPTFYEKHFHGKYFWWDNKDLDKVKKYYFGGSIDIPHTKTNLRVGVENIRKYIYFKSDTVLQYIDDIQILGATLQQNLKLGALHWDNQIAYQMCGSDTVIPLPEWSLYSNLYIDFKIAKVLTIQLGANVHYFTKYKSPTYEPVTQQFKVQTPDKNNEYVEVGDYPLINAYINCHLKYTRFFVEFYNIGSSFIDQPKYFSMPHYPVNPMVFKFGLSWDFHN